MCKDIPTNLDYIAPFTDEYAAYMHAFVKKTKCKRSYRLTDMGYTLLA